MAPEDDDAPARRFATALREALARHRLPQVEAARRLETSAAYVSALAKGKRAMSPARIDRLAEKLDLDEEETRRLHRAAALDAGFRLDLPDDF